MAFSWLMLQKNDCIPWMEIYDGDEIHFVGVTDHNEAFYVEEAMKLEQERSKAAEQGK